MSEQITKTSSRFVVEAMVIVASILLAFAIDAWWDQRQERRDESEAIAQLEVDFRSNAARLDTIRARHEAALEAAYDILARAGMGGVSESTSSTAELAFVALRAWTYDPVLGGINSLIQSGKLGILRNDSLRVALAGWPDIVEDLNGDEWIESRTTFEVTAPYLAERRALFDALRAAGRLSRLDVEPTSDWSSLLSDSVFVQMMSWRVNSLEVILVEVDAVDASIRRILELLEESRREGF